VDMHQARVFPWVLPPSSRRDRLIVAWQFTARNDLKETRPVGHGLSWEYGSVHRTGWEAAFDRPYQTVPNGTVPFF